MVPAAAAAVFIVILFTNRDRVKIENNISALYTMRPSMLEAETTTARILNHGSSGWYFIVSGASVQETLEHEEFLIERLDEEIVRGNLKAILGTSVFIPSEEKQKKTYAAMKALVPLAEAQYENLGFPPGYAERYRNEFASAEGKYCRPDGDIPPYIKDLTSNLWIGGTGGNFYSCVLPLHAGDEAVFRSLADEYDFVFFINKSKDIGKELDALTKSMLIIFLAAFGIIIILVRLLYSSKDTIHICSVPFILILSALAVLSSNNIPLGFFPAAGLVMVFGLGLDYIFYIKGRDAGKNGRSPTRLAVILSFATTALSFGALALSSFAPVHIFGLTVFAGITAAFITAMFLSGGGQSENQRTSGGSESSPSSAEASK
jgi:predicted exporter